MTIGEAIRQLDVIKPNAVDRAAKVRWLEEVDFAVYRELVMTHEHGRSLIFNGYNPEDESGADDKLLLAVKPYDRMYVQYLACQIDLQNQEYDLYQNDAALYNQSYNDYAKYYNRQVMPLQSGGLHARTWNGGERKCICPALNL